MQFINYFFASIISFSGLLIGLLLVKVAPEEQKPLEKHFVLFGKILLLMIFVFILFYHINDYFNILIQIGLLVFLLFIDYKVIDLRKKSAVVYAMLGILFFLSSGNQNLFVIASSLMLLYGLPAASSLYDKKGDYCRPVIYNAGFLVIANLLFFL